MLDKLDLTKTTDEKKYDEALSSLQDRLGILQRALRDLNIPTIIVIEGWNAAGITMTVHEIVLALDPRGYTLNAIERPTAEEKSHLFLWRFWLRIPPRGRFGLFARSWYSRAITEEMQNPGWQKSLKGRSDRINKFERQLNDDGAIIFKFFLHITKEEQKQRLEQRERNPLTAWLVTPAIWSIHHHYDDTLPLLDDFIDKTNTDYAPWTMVEATDQKYAILKIYRTLVKTLEKRVAKEKEGTVKTLKGKNLIKPPKISIQRRSAPDAEITRETGQQLLSSLQIEMQDIQYLLFKRKIPLIIIYEGWDAAGKGGNITRMTRFLNPLGYYVVPISAPSPAEQQFNYLRRFVKRFPAGGDIAIFDRSWYGRVLVERVEGYCSEPEWQRAYNEINEIEEDYVTSSGGGIVKFWLEINKDEQLKRFNERAADPLKVHKITDDDWRNREKWDQYEEAVEEMLARTSTEAAPWTVVESDDKWFARIKTLKTAIASAQRLL